MNMPAVMHSLEKPAPLKKISDQGNTGNKNGLNADDNGLFATLLLMLSLSGNNQAMQQVADPASSSSNPGSANNMQMSQLSQIESGASGKHLHGHKYEREDGSNKNDKAGGIADSHSMDVHMLLSGDSETYSGIINSDSFKEDLSNHIENNSGINPDIRPEIVSNIFNDPVNSGNKLEIHQTQSYADRTDIVSQLSEKVVNLYHIGGHTAKIRLQPDELGHLHIDISVADDSIKAVVTVEDSSVKNILESNLDLLIQDLKNSGLNIEQFTVNISSSSDYRDNLAGGWSGWNGNTMFNDNNLQEASVIDDSVMYDSNDIFVNAGMGVINIFV